MVLKYKPKEGDSFFKCSCGLVFKAPKGNIKCPICSLLGDIKKSQYVKFYNVYEKLPNTRVPNIIKRFVNEQYKTNK